jgi:hypothetical protein
MTTTVKPIYVAFAEKKLENDYNLLNGGRFEDKQLYRFIERVNMSYVSGGICIYL